MNSFFLHKLHLLEILNIHFGTIKRYYGVGAFVLCFGNKTAVHFGKNDWFCVRENFLFCSEKIAFCWFDTSLATLQGINNSYNKDTVRYFRYC